MKKISFVKKNKNQKRKRNVSDAILVLFLQKQKNILNEGNSTQNNED